MQPFPETSNALERFSTKFNIYYILGLTHELNTALIL